MAQQLNTLTAATGYLCVGNRLKGHYCGDTFELAAIAQLAARQSHNLKVASSSLAGGIHFYEFLCTVFANNNAKRHELK